MCLHFQWIRKWSEREANSKNSRWCCKSEIHRYFHSCHASWNIVQASINNLNVQLRIITFECVFAYVFLYSVSCDIPSNHVDFSVMHGGRWTFGIVKNTLKILFCVMWASILFLYRETRESNWIEFQEVCTQHKKLLCEAIKFF